MISELVSEKRSVCFRYKCVSTWSLADKKKNMKLIHILRPPFSCCLSFKEVVLKISGIKTWRGGKSWNTLYMYIFVTLYNLRTFL